MRAGARRFIKPIIGVHPDSENADIILQCAAAAVSVYAADDKIKNDR
jgi:hypothetical protein